MRPPSPPKFDVAASPPIGKCRSNSGEVRLSESRATPVSSLGPRVRFVRVRTCFLGVGGVWVIAGGVPGHRFAIRRGAFSLLLTAALA